MIIFIKSSYGTLYIDTELSETIEIIKQKIEEKIFNEPERQTLFFNGRILQNEKTLADYNIQKESVLRLYVDKTAYCFIIYGKGERFKINGYCPCCSNILYLKQRIEEILEIDTKFQQLIVDGKIMEDNDSLLKSGLGEDGKEVILKIINNDE